MDDTRTSQDDKASDDEPDHDDQSADGDDRPAGEGGGPAEADDGARLDELGDRIQSVRAEAEDAVEGVAADDEKYTESGDDQSADEDDQTIAPPG